MSSSSTTSKQLLSETGRGQRLPDVETGRGQMLPDVETGRGQRLPDVETGRGQRLPDVDAAQQLKLRERQRFFEEVFQHDVDVYLSSSHLCIRDYKRPPMGSISSMEVNVDLLDQMELFDVSDQDGLDVFLSSVGEEPVLPPVPAQRNNNNNEESISNGSFQHALQSLDAKNRTTSTSSDSSCDSQMNNVDGGNTPVVLTDDEEMHNTAAAVHEREEAELPAVR